MVMNAQTLAKQAARFGNKPKFKIPISDLLIETKTSLVHSVSI